MFGFGRKGRAGVGCYGKLPQHGDYLSHASDGAEARRLTAWLDEGYRLTGGTDDPRAPGTRFVLPGGKRALFGVLWPSGDASGTRRFPFSLFAPAAAREVAGLGAALPVALAPLWFRMEAAFPSLREAGTPEAVRALLEEIPLPPELPPAPEVRTELLDGAAAAGDAGGAVDLLFDLRRLADLLSAGKRTVPAFAAMLPLGTGYAPEIEAGAWLEVLARRLGAGFPGESRLFLRPGRAGSPGALFVIHRELRAEDLGFVLSPREDYPYANLLGTPGDDPGAAEFRERLAERLGPSPTLRDLVDLDP